MEPVSATYGKLRDEVSAIGALRATLAERLEASGLSDASPLPGSVSEGLPPIRLLAIILHKAKWSCSDTASLEGQKPTCGDLKAHLELTAEILARLDRLLDREGTPTPAELQQIDDCISEGQGPAGALDLWLSFWRPAGQRQ